MSARPTQLTKRYVVVRIEDPEHVSYLGYGGTCDPDRSKARVFSKTPAIEAGRIFRKQGISAGIEVAP